MKMMAQQSAEVATLAQCKHEERMRQGACGRRSRWLASGLKSATPARAEQAVRAQRAAEHIVALKRTNCADEAGAEEAETAASRQHEQAAPTARAARAARTF